jgi:hypothetical protein
LEWSGRLEADDLDAEAPPAYTHPHSRNSTPLNSVSIRASEAPVSDFARDFYATGGGYVSESQSQSSSSNTNKYAHPLSPPLLCPQSSNSNADKIKAGGATDIRAYIQSSTFVEFEVLSLFGWV